MTREAVTIRLAHSQDASALTALAQLDSAEPPLLPVLVAELGGELRAALSLVNGAAVADPFHPTGELVSLLRIRAEQLTARPNPGPLASVRSALASLLPRATAA